MNEDICQLCKKEKLVKDSGYWLHWVCFYKLQEFVRKQYGTAIGNNTRLWTLTQRKQFLKEYHKKNKERVEFT